MSQIKITDDSFQTDVLDSKTPVLIDFWAEWCGPCRAITSSLEELASEFSGRLTVAKLNIDENPQTILENKQIAELKIDTQRGFDDLKDLVLGKYRRIQEAVMGAENLQQLGAASGVSLPAVLPTGFDQCWKCKQFAVPHNDCRCTNCGAVTDDF